MVERVRLKSSRGAGTLETILESLRDYTYQVEDCSRQKERQRTRILFVGYILASFILISALLAIFIVQRADKGEQWLSAIIIAFTFITILIVPFIAISAVSRYRQIHIDLKRSVILLEDTMRFASQIRDHVELDRLEQTLLALRLKEADATLAHAARIVRSKSF